MPATRRCKARTLLAATPSANRLTINTQRVTDLKVRQALNYAIDRDGLVKTLGGQTVARADHHAHAAGHDRLPGVRRLSGRRRTATSTRPRNCSAAKTPELVLGVADDSTEQEMATQLKGNLEKAGFKITVQDHPGRREARRDQEEGQPLGPLHRLWAADWPSGASILPVLFDGRTIKAEGNSNQVATSTTPALNAEFDRIQAMPPADQGPEWGKLDERIMKEYAPVVPLYVDVAYTVHGSKAGGVFISSVFGYPSFVNAHVRR